MKFRRGAVKAGALALYVVVFIGASAVGGMSYFHYAPPEQTCAGCHEMTGVHERWALSTHRSVHCRNCHGGSLTADVHALESHLNRIVRHVSGDTEESIQLHSRDLLQAADACRQCHPQSYADWRSGGHATTNGRIFLDAAQNESELLADDCLRCHGMFHEGGIAALVTPLARQGPWQIRPPAQAGHAAIPCLACHQIHRAASPGASGAAFFDQRERIYVDVARLPSPRMVADGRPLRLSSDPRQRLCVQCHAPSLAAAHAPGSGDDRIARGVHEGLSCLDCHQHHNNSARASCQACHPQSSHCGLDVEKMDTTFLAKQSAHDVHTVACRDCHAAGIPGRN